MKNFNIIGLLLILSVSFSCKKQYLDKTPDEDMTLEEAFSNSQYAERFLTACYSALPYESSFNDLWGRNPFVGASDEMEITWTYPFSHWMTNASWNASNVDNFYDDFKIDYMYKAPWKGIRKVNIFLENIDKVPFGDRGANGEIQKGWFKGEAHFLRAFYHFIELRVHGPIPILDASTKGSENLLDFKRSSYDECVDFIVKECDAAASMLPATRDMVTQAGRPSKIAALALKSRLLLYAASPLFNGNPDYANFRNVDGTPFFGAYDASKWQKAADAAKECITQAEAAGHALYYSPSGDPMRNYYETFIARWNKEVLFALNLGTYFNNHNESCMSPNGMGGWSGYCPTQELVDDYEMANGTRPITGYNADGSPIINAASGYVETGYAATASAYHPAGVRNMYVGREPRFYASINFSGQMWRGRRIEFWNTGLDGRGKSSDHSVTGYLMRKTSDEAVNLPQMLYTLKTWNYFRLAEIYLNYAEALNEAQGPVGDVYTYINKVRTRSGMPGLPAGLSKEEMRERIQHERRIELSFETHRYFDTRRWKIAAQTDNKMFYTMNVGAGTNLQDNAFYTRIPFKKRIFEAPKHYLWPIPQQEIDKSRALVQNPGW